MKLLSFRNETCILLQVRGGLGVMTYANGDTLEGMFRSGQPHGRIVYTFVSTGGRVRLAQYERGTRLHWIELKKKRKKNANRPPGVERLKIEK